MKRRHVTFSTLLLTFASLVTLWIKCTKLLLHSIQYCYATRRRLANFFSPITSFHRLCEWTLWKYRKTSIFMINLHFSALMIHVTTHGELHADGKTNKSHGRFIYQSSATENVKKIFDRSYKHKKIIFQTKVWIDEENFPLDFLSFSHLSRRMGNFMQTVKQISHMVVLFTNPQRRKM